MIFESNDIEFLLICGLCRYIPTRLAKRYDIPFFGKNFVGNLTMHKLIKLQSDSSSYKLTSKGRELIAGMGYDFPQDARLDIHKPSYKRKLISAEVSFMMYLAGINVFYRYPKELAGISEGYASTLMMRADKNMKVLSGSQFLGIYKNGDTVYIPYFVESKESQILPSFEKSMFMSQIDSMRNIKSVKLMLFGKTLEELWASIISKPSEPFERGRKSYNEALEEMGIEYLLIPNGQNGVLQLSILRDCRYRQRIASAASCKITEKDNLSECDGVQGNSPYIIAIDMNIGRILKALKRIERVDKNTVPTLCCLPFQKTTLAKMLNKYKCQKTVIRTVGAEGLLKMFPLRDLSRKHFLTKEGDYAEVPSNDTKTP